MKAEVQSNIRQSLGKLMDVVSRFDQSQIDVVPFEGSWTAGQVAEHITKGLSGMPRLVAGKTEVTTRAYNAKAQPLRDLFLDFSIKFQSPDFILPTKTVHAQTKLIIGLRQIETELLDVADKNDLTLSLLDFEMPQFGTLTIYEMLDFMMAHAQRHTHQLEHIYARLNP
ncbi:DinB family protein [Flavobacterium sp.]|uniref:DinB family protein n=1 Tax=Flavobacterium sp. TaxID=239 RepID=UPI0039E6E0F6